MPIINYFVRGFMGEYDYGQPEKKKEFHWLTIDALFFWVIEICELYKWCGKSILGVFHRRNNDKSFGKVVSREICILTWECGG